MSVQLDRINEIRQLFLDSLDGALDGLSADIRDDAKAAMARIKKSGYKRSTALTEARALARRTNNKTRIAVAEQIELAASYADRSASILRAHDVAKRLGANYNTGALVAAAEAAILKPGLRPADAIAQYGARAGKPAGVPGLAPSKEIGLSARLHGSAAYNVDITERKVGQIIREGVNLDRAGKELVETMRSPRPDLTKPLKRLQRAGRKLRDLSVNSNDPIERKLAKKEWNSSFRNIERIARSRVDKRAGYKELLQIIERRGAKGMDQALNRWMSEKQRYNAERIIETESAAAYRQREIQQHEKRAVGAWWRLNRFGSKTRKQAGRKRGRRTGGRRKKKGVQRGCICDTLSNQFFTMEMIKEYPRMGHPYCRCYWDWKYQTVDLTRPVSQEDRDWFNSLPE